LLARTTALENTELPTLYTKIEKAERRKRAVEALAMVGWPTAQSISRRKCPGGSNSEWRCAALVNRPSILLAE